MNLTILNSAVKKTVLRQLLPAASSNQTKVVTINYSKCEYHQDQGRV